MSEVRQILFDDDTMEELAVSRLGHDWFVLLETPFVVDYLRYGDVFRAQEVPGALRFTEKIRESPYVSLKVAAEARVFASGEFEALLEQLARVGGGHELAMGSCMSLHVPRDAVLNFKTQLADLGVAIHWDESSSS